jgi:hypothetical protein
MRRLMYASHETSQAVFQQATIVEYDREMGPKECRYP